MNQYLVDTNFAVENLFELITKEKKQTATLKQQMDLLKEQANQILSEAYYMADQDIDDLETPAMIAIRHGYVRFLSASQEIEKKIDRMKASYEAKDISVRALCGSILQIAKQGISIVHNDDLNNVPVIIDTKSSEAIHNIIWQGRNQSMHYEDGSYNNKVVSCFTNLQLAYGSDLDLSVGDNKAKHIVFDAALRSKSSSD